MIEDNKKQALKLRPHSNTISGGRPPNIDVSKCRPLSIRRNSEGSPSFPPPISVSEPTPIEPSSTPGAKTDGTVKSSGENLEPENQKGSRSRTSSVNSNKSGDMKESSAIQKLRSKMKSRQSLEETDYPADNSSSVAISLANTSGIYLANGKRNQDFHVLFRSVPENDGLLEDYGCALQKEILLQGRIYISENHICFNANIFGWVTNLVIAFADIIEIEKKSTAYFIPNAIQISTDTSKHFFASFLSRDVTYDLMVDIWRLARPDLAPPKVPKGAQNVEAESSDDESDSYYDSDTEDSYSDDTEANVSNTKEPDDDIKAKKPPALRRLDPNRRRAASEAIRPSFQTGEGVKSSSNIDISNGAKNKTPSSAGASTETKPQLHDKTECECGANGEHYPNVVFDQVYSGTVDKFYDLLFKNDFMSKFLTENQKTTELDMGDWRNGDGKVVLVRDYSYIKPLNGAIGPKSTKCFIKEEIFNQDTQNFVSSLATTSTPDVPAGGSFSCKTRTCLTWAGKGKVRILVTVLVDFTKSSWLKSTIEKASIDGQQTFYKDLDAAFQTYFKQHPEEFGGSKTKRKRRDRSSKTQSTANSETNKKDSNKPKSAVHHILGSFSNRVADIIVSIINALSSPRATHLTLVCLIAMVCINIFIAQRMSFVEQQLLELRRNIPKREETTIQFIPNQQSNHQRDKGLWDWLDRLDSEEPAIINEEINVVKKKDVVWDDNMKIRKQAKDRLDRHMLELSNMIQKAEINLKDITSAVQEQRDKIKSSSSQNKA